MPAGPNAYNSLWQVRTDAWSTLEIPATTRPAPPPEPSGPEPAAPGAR